jgi:hypothetical protein
LEVNGKPLPYRCSLNEGALEEYLIQRGSRKLKMAVPRVSANEIVLRASDGRFSVVGLKHSNPMPSFLPYISGAVLRKTSYGFLVDKIIPGTPAEGAGLKKGSRILSILDAVTGQPSTLGEGADYRAELTFVFASGGVKTTKTIKLRALSEVLSSIVSPRTPSQLSASLRTGAQ